jgi:PilZ domain
MADELLDSAVSMPKIHARFHSALASQRRGAKRYDITLSLRYAVRRRGQQPLTGTGQSLNVSSSGLLFRSDGRPESGDSIIVALEWPAGGAGGDPIFLVLSGHVVRTQGRAVALSISRNDLLRSNDLEKAFETFLRREWKIPLRRPPALTPTALVDDDETASSVIEAVLSPYGWTIERASAETARRILAAGFPPIRLLVTRTIGMLDDLRSDFPVILTLEEGVPESAAEQLHRMRRLVIVRKPIIYGELRSAILQFCQEKSPLTKGHTV